jgi:hypothetical protein
MTLLDNVLASARAELGKPYVWGAEGPNTFDCSGLMQFIFAENGINLPRTAEEQRKATSQVTNPVAGDLVFYGAPAHHVALYIGNGYMLAAPSTGDVVKIQKVYGSPTYGRIAKLGNTTTAPIGNLAQTVGLSLNPADWLGGVKNIVLEGVFVCLGIGLVGYGAYRAFAQNKEGA